MNAKHVAGLALVLVLMMSGGAWGMQPGGGRPPATKRSDPAVFPPLGVGGAVRPKAAAKSLVGAAVMVGEASSAAPGEAAKALETVGNRITSSIAAANDRIAKFGSDIARLGSLIESLQNQKAGLDARVGDATKTHGTVIPAAIAAITTEHEKLTQEHATLSGEVKKLTAEESALTGQQEDLVGKLASAETELARLKAEAEALPGQHDKEQKNLQSRHAGQMTQTADKHKGQADPLSERISAAVAAREKAQKDLKAVQDELAGVDAKLANISKSAEEKGAEVKAVKAQDQSTTARHDETKGNVDTLDADVKALTAQLSVLQEDRRGVETARASFDREYANGLSRLQVPNAEALIKAATVAALETAGISEANFDAALS